jgi:hypothetical protein
LPVGLYGCETWSLTLREEHRLRVLGNTVLRRIFGSDRDEVTKEWRKLRNEELNEMYHSTNIVQVIKIENDLGGELGTHGGGEVCTGFFSGEI